MEKNELIVLCPCCDTKLWIDKETGGILKKESPAKIKKGFDNLFTKYKEQQAKSGNALKKAFEEEKKRKILLKKKFKRAMDDVDESDPDEN